MPLFNYLQSTEFNRHILCQKEMPIKLRDAIQLRFAEKNLNAP